MSHNGRLGRSSAYRPARRAADVVMLGVFETLACTMPFDEHRDDKPVYQREPTSEIYESLLWYLGETVTLRKF